MVALRLCLVLMIFQSTRSCDVESVVETNGGTIKGLKADDGDYYVYKGIPYGTVDPCNPFGPALQYPPFESVFEAFDDSAMCPQVNEDNNNTIMGTLNCLNLNIYVPANTRTSNPTLPVMVWLYGGGFRYGSAATFRARYLVQHDVIVVTLNYRTGPYGFMCLDIPEVSGNQGLKDQYLAFQWVKDNIQAFGGDPDSITVFGQSAGGHSIDLHLLSPRDILFNKGILESGSALSLTVLFEPDKLAPLKLAKYLNYETDDIKDALQFLTNTSTDLVIAATKSLDIKFKPCVETAFDNNSEPFITKSWINTNVPKVRNVRIMIGFNEDELASKDFPIEAKDLRNLTADHLKQVFKFNKHVLDEMNDLITHFYYGDEKVNENLKWAVIRFDSDFTYIYPVHRTLQRYLHNGAENIYFYKFSYVGGRNALTTLKDDDQCCSYPCCTSHMDDVAYLFDLRDKPVPTANDQTIIQRMTTMWTNFAKYSDPTPVVSELLPVKWVPVTKDTYNYLNIDTKLTLGKRPLHERMAFWDVFYKYYKKYQKGYEPE